MTTDQYMTIEQIKAAVDAGAQVRWANDAYHVTRDSFGRYLITYQPNQSTIGLTNKAGNKLNGQPHDFYIKQGFNESTDMIPDYVTTSFHDAMLAMAAMLDFHPMKDTWKIQIVHMCTGALLIAITSERGSITFASRQDVRKALAEKEAHKGVENHES